MSFLKFILLVLIPSVLKGDCGDPEIIISKKQNLCSGETLNITCQFGCRGPLNLVKDGRSLQSSNLGKTLFVHVHSANESHSGLYGCRTEQKSSMTHITVNDCGVSTENIFTENATLSPLTNSTHQTSTLSGVLEQVLTWYILFKTGVFLIGSTTAALTIVCRRG